MTADRQSTIFDLEHELNFVFQRAEIADTVRRHDVSDGAYLTATIDLVNAVTKLRAEIVKRWPEHFAPAPGVVNPIGDARHD